MNLNEITGELSKVWRHHRKNSNKPYLSKTIGSLVDIYPIELKFIVF